MAKRSALCGRYQKARRQRPCHQQTDGALVRRAHHTQEAVHDTLGGAG